MRLGFVAPWPAKAGIVAGGVEAAASALVSGLQSNPSVERVAIVCFEESWSGGWKRSDTEALSVIRIPAQRFGLLSLYGLDALRCRKVFRGLDVDVVHAHGALANGLRATLAGRPKVVTVHGIPFLDAKYELTPGVATSARLALMRAGTSVSLRHARAVVSISQYDAQLFQNSIGMRGKVIPNAIESTFYRANAFRPDLNCVLFAGRVIPRKNVLGLLRAFASSACQDPTLVLKIAGPCDDAEYEKAVRGEIARLSLQGRVRLLGNLSVESLAIAIGESRLVALCSFQETLPTIIAQAMAMGRPVVAWNVAGVGEMLGGSGGGYLIEKGDYEGLSAAITKVTRSADLCVELGLRGRQRALELYHPSKVAARHVELYKSVLPSR